MKRISNLGSSLRSSLGGGGKKEGADDDGGAADDESTHATSTVVPVMAADNVPPTLVGRAWKRRGGVTGKLITKTGAAWELRRFELVGRKLFYYVTEDDDATNASGASDTFQTTIVEASSSNENQDVKPRGCLDLTENSTAVYASYGHSGAPSPFCISFQVGVTKEIRWKLAFDTLQEQMEWLAAITTVIVQGSVDEYNGLLLQSASLQTVNQQIDGGALFVHYPSVREPPVPPSSLENFDDSETFSVAGGHRLWMMESYTIQYNDPYSGSASDEPVATKKQTTSQIHSAIVDSNKSLMMLYQQSQSHAHSLQDQIKSLKQDYEAKIAALCEVNNESSTEEKSPLAVEALQLELSHLQEQHEGLVTDLIAKHNHDLDEQRKVFEEQLAQATSSNEVSETQGEKVTILENTKQEWTTQIEDLRHRVNELTAAKELLEEQHKLKLTEQKQKLELDHQTAMVASQQELAQKEADIQTLKDKLASIILKYDEVLASIKTQSVVEADLSTASLKEQLHSLQAELDSITLASEAAKEEHDSYTEDLKKEIGALRAQNQSLITEATSIKDSKKTDEDQIDTAALEGSQLKLLAEVEALQTRIKELVTAQELLEENHRLQQVEQKQALEVANRTMLSESQHGLAQKESQIQTLQDDLDSVKQEWEKNRVRLEEQVQGLLEELKSATLASEAAQVESDARVETLKSEVEALQSRNQTLLSEVSLARDNQKALLGQIKAMVAAEKPVSQVIQDEDEDEFEDCVAEE